MPSSSLRVCGEPSDMPTSTETPVHGGRLLSASICSFSMKMVSVRSQLKLRIVRSTNSEFPTLLKSGCVLVSIGVFFQRSVWYWSIATKVFSAVTLSGNGFDSSGHVCPSPQNPYMNVSTYSTSAWAANPPAVRPVFRKDRLRILARPHKEDRPQLTSRSVSSQEHCLRTETALQTAFCGSY